MYFRAQLDTQKQDGHAQDDFPKAMSNIKAVISLLCKIINISLGVNLKPEHFRLAKFNEEEENVMSHLWQILHKILIKIKLIDHSCDGGDLVNFVKLNLILMKYESMEFYCLPNDMSYGSRELLLAIGWLLATESVVENLVINKVRKSLFGKEFVDCATSQEVPITRKHDQKSQTLPVSLDDQLNYIVWLAGSIKSNINNIEETDKARMKLMTQVHAGSVGTCGLPHLSVSEATLVRQPQHLTLHLQLVEADAQIIDAYKQWRIKAHVFWEWMDSVLEEKENCFRSHSINVGEKNYLMQFINVLRLKMKSLNHVQDQCLKSSSEPSSSGMPRFILAHHETETELSHWLPDSEKRVQTLEQEYKSKEEEIIKELYKLENQMKDVQIVSSLQLFKSSKDL